VLELVHTATHPCLQPLKPMRVTWRIEARMEVLLKEAVFQLLERAHIVGHFTTQPLVALLFLEREILDKKRAVRSRLGPSFSKRRDFDRGLADLLYERVLV